MRFVLERVTRTLESSTRRFELDIPAFRVDRGEVIALVGDSGSGKTAMMELLALAAAPDEGGRFVLTGDEEVDIAGLWRHARLKDLAAARSRHLGFVAQTGGLLEFLTVRENVALAQHVAGRHDRHRVERLARTLGIDGVLDERPARLSIGQRQRTAILRALAHRPAFVIADEPTSALDPGTAREVIDLLLETASGEGAGILVSTHNVALMAHAGVETVHVVPAPGASHWVSRVERRR